MSSSPRPLTKAPDSVNVPELEPSADDRVSEVEDEPDEMADHEPGHPAPEPRRPARGARLIGLRRGEGYAQRVKQQFGHGAAGFNPYDYENKYPEDPFCGESGPNARVWWTYLDVAGEYDAERVDAWKDTIDVLLIFAGLFSAIVTGFAVQAWQNVQTDYAEVSATLLYQLLTVQLALQNGTSPAVLSSTITPPTSEPFYVSSLNRWVNGLWFTSLCLSLSAALIAILTKQWLHHYMSAVSGTPRERTMVRQFRYEGLEKWRVPLITDLLPFILHISLALFLAGLILFLFPLTMELRWITGTITALTYSLYLSSVLLPLVKR